MAYSFGRKSPWCTELVCVKHEGIPLHYKNITKQEKARTGVIVHLKSLRRGEKYCYINLIKKEEKSQWTPRKRKKTNFQIHFGPQCLTIPNNYYSYICNQLVSLTHFSMSHNKCNLTFKNGKKRRRKKKKKSHISKLSKGIQNRKKIISKQAICIYITYTLRNRTHVVHPWQSLLILIVTLLCLHPSVLFVWRLKVGKRVCQLLKPLEPQNEKERVVSGSLWWNFGETTWDEGRGAQRLSPGWYWGSVAVK